MSPSYSTDLIVRRGLWRAKKLYDLKSKYDEIERQDKNPELTKKLLQQYKKSKSQIAKKKLFSGRGEELGNTLPQNLPGWGVGGTAR